MEVIVNIDISVPDWAARWTPGPSAAPLSAQLAEQIKSAVCRGQLRPGARLPSIRQLANELRVSHDTVANAYRSLEHDSIIRTDCYRRVMVHPNAPANGVCRVRRTNGTEE